MPDKTSSVIDAYIRVSRVGGREGASFVSPEQQRDQISMWAKLRGYEIAEWHTDLDQTGGKLSRPGLDAAMQRVRSGATGGIAVAYLDRLSRASVPDALALVSEIVEDHGAQFVAIDLGVDPTTPFGEFGLTLMLALARMQRRRIGDTWRDSRQRAVERGVHISGAPPTGYTKGPDGRLVEDPHAGRVIREAFHKRATGASWSSLAAFLDENDVPGPYGSAQWTGRVVQRMLGRPVYLGRAHSGDFVNHNAHPPLVDRATWQAARDATSMPAVRGEPALFSGLLRCAGCRYVMRPSFVQARTGRKRLYSCRKQHAAGECPSPASILETTVEQFIVDAFFERFSSIGAERQANASGLDELEHAALVAEQELAAYRDNQQIAGILGVDRYVEGLQARTARADDAARALTDARSAVSVEFPSVKALTDAWPQLTVVEQRELLHAGIDCVFVRSVGQSTRVPVGDRARILWHGEAPDDLPRRGRRVPLLSYTF